MSHGQPPTSTNLSKNTAADDEEDSLSVPQALNESATQLFCSGVEASVDEGVAVMDEVVIPCLHLMSRDLALSQEDQEAMEGVRSHWCSCLSRSMDGESHLMTSSPGSVQLKQSDEEQLI